MGWGDDDTVTVENSNIVPSMKLVPNSKEDSVNNTVIHNDEYKINDKSENEVYMKAMTVHNTFTMLRLIAYTLVKE